MPSPTHRAISSCNQRRSTWPKSPSSSHMINSTLVELKLLKPVLGMFVVWFCLLLNYDVL
jgi:hypothetical protein